VMGVVVLGVAGRTEWGGIFDLVDFVEVGE